MYNNPPLSEKSLCSIYLLCITAVMSLGVFGPIPMAGAAIYYLDAVWGNDDYVGSSESPWRTLVKAQSESQSGDTVILREGNYGDFVESLDAGSGRSNWLTFTAEAGHCPVFTKIYIENVAHVSSYLRFDGITVQLADPNPWPDPQNPPWSKSNCVTIVNGDYVEITNCIIRGANKYLSRHGVKVMYCDNVAVDHCDISNVGAGTLAIDCNNYSLIYNHVHDMSEGSGVRVQADNLSPVGIIGTVIRANHIHGQSADAADDYYPAGYHPGSGISIRISNVTISENIVHDGFAQGIMFYADETGLMPYENMILENNLFYDVGFNRLRNVGGVITIRNNTFVGCINDDRPDNKYGILDRYSGIPLLLYFTSGFDGTGVVVYNNIVVGPWDLPDPDTHNYQEDYNIFWRRGGDPYYQFGKGSHTLMAVWRNNTSPYALRGYPEFFEELDLGPATLTPEWPNDEPNVAFFVDPHYYTNWQVPSYQQDRGRICDYHLAEGSAAINFGDPNYQTSYGLGTIDPNGFIRDDGAGRNAEYHSAGCYEFGFYERPENYPPVLAPIGDKIGYVDILLSFTIRATDTDGDNIQYSSQNLPAGSTLDDDFFSWTPDANQLDDHVVTFIASDGLGQDHQQITITVMPEPLVPIAPSSLARFASTKNTINWFFNDNSSNEDGFYGYDDSQVRWDAPADPNGFMERELTPNTQHTRYVVAYNDYGQSDASNIETAWTMPADPAVICNRETGLPAKAISTEFIFDNDINFGSGGVAYYRCVWNYDPNEPDFGGSEQRWDDGQLLFGTPQAGNWYLHLMSYNANDEPGSGGNFGPYVIWGPPDVPSGLTHVAAGADDISWWFVDHSGYEDGFYGYDDANNIVWTVPADPNGYLETGLVPNTAYTRRVRAYSDYYGQSSLSDSHTAWTLPAESVLTCDRPTGNPAVPVGSVFTFTNELGFGPGTVAYYRYAWNTDPNSYSFDESDPNWFEGGLVLNANSAGRWFVHLMGYNTNYEPGGESMLGPYCVLDAPVLHAEPDKTLLPCNTISWDAVAGAELYHAQCATSVTFDTIASQSDWVGQTEFEFCDLVPGRDYWFRVRAGIAGACQSAWSQSQYSFQCGMGGDFEPDCDVDLADFAVLAPSWLTDPNDADWNDLCDISDPNDNIIDVRDLLAFTQDWLAGVGR